MDRENKPQQDNDGRGEDFLERWSRRKLETQPGSEDATAGESGEANSPVPLADEPEQVLTDTDMPPVETLDEDSDYSPFLSPGVSDDLRQQAMRKLFTQPEFNITDGLNDYDEDYTKFTGLGKVITHEMKRMLQRELDADKAAAETTDVQTASSKEPAKEVTAAAETEATDRVVTDAKNDDADSSDVTPADNT